MTQCELEQLVAEATGEDLCQIRSRGFGLADPWEVDFDPEPDELPLNIIDWDDIDLERNIALVDQTPFRRRAA